ncbi:hypothetical protein PO909_023537 [Leuciscus waleckii]
MLPSWTNRSLMSQQLRVSPGLLSAFYRRLTLYCDCQNILVTKLNCIRFSDNMLQCLYGTISGKLVFFSFFLQIS